MHSFEVLGEVLELVYIVDTGLHLSHIEFQVILFLNIFNSITYLFLLELWVRFQLRLFINLKLGVHEASVLCLNFTNNNQIGYMSYNI